MSIDTVNAAIDHETGEGAELSLAQLDQVLQFQQTIFSQVASNKDHLDVLSALCQMAEQLLPNSVASIMMKDPETGLLSVLVAPSVPQAGIDALSCLKPGTGGGSCGNAVYRNEPVFVSDTKTDPRWHDLRKIAFDFNLCACWSMPIRDLNGEPIGSFALSSFEHRSPSQFHVRLLDVGASIVNIVLSKRCQEEALEKQQQQLIEALEFDSLTGLPNQSKLNIDLRELQGENSLLLVNIDNFRFINTAYGPAFGDLFLNQAGKLLKQVLPRAELYRLNADEFALLYPGRVDLKEQVETLKNYLFRHPVEIENQSFNISFSAGGSVAESGLLGQSIQAMGQAKARGKGYYHAYDVDDETDQAGKMEYIHWNRVLHDALNQSRIIPFFQGVRDNKSGEIGAYEALARLELDGQIFTPFHFLKTAALSGLLPRLSRVIIDAAFKEIGDSSRSVSINITEDDLTQEYLEQYLQDCCRKYRVNSSQVVLEILEGISSSGKKNHIAQLGRLKALGFRLAIDDFGTEYSNFERILELDIDYLKIDAKYIRNIDTDSNSYEIARAIVYFAKNAGIKTVAEFVHNEAVQKVVEELGIDFSQGYLFSEPAPSIKRD